jgi:hypothetical protein
MGLLKKATTLPSNTTEVASTKPYSCPHIAQPMPSADSMAIITSSTSRGLSRIFRIIDSSGENITARESLNGYPGAIAVPQQFRRSIPTAAQLGDLSCPGAEVAGLLRQSRPHDFVLNVGQAETSAGMVLA